ncbi:hypothetical protein Tco_0519579, partial [Tanacetum coccineum]
MVCAAIVETLKLKLRILELSNLIQQYGNTSFGPIWIKVCRNVHMCKLQYYLGQLKSDMRCPGLMIDGNMSRIWELIFFDEVPSFDNVETSADASVET